MYLNSKIIKILLFLFIIISFLLVIQHLFQTSIGKEGFNVNDLVNDVKSVANVANDIKNGITGLGNNIANGVSKIQNVTGEFSGLVDKIQKQTTGIIEDTMFE